MATASRRAERTEPVGRALRFRLEIGKLIRARRTELGLTQTGLARHVGVSQQQIVKYEKGVGRIPADSLLTLCRTLRIDPASVFYPLNVADGMTDGLTDGMADGLAGGFAESAAPPFVVEASADRDTVALVRAFRTIGDKAVRRTVLDLVATLADASPAKPKSEKARRKRS